MREIIQGLKDTDSSYGVLLEEDRKGKASFWAYRDIYQKIIAYAAYFREQGIGKGDRVIFPFETTSEVIVSFFATIAIGAIPLSVKPYIMGNLKESYLEFIGKIVRQYKASYILDSPSLETLELAVPRLPISGPEFNSKITLEMSQKNGLDNDIAFVQFSSGSTSFPKGIPVTHEKIVAQLQMIESYSQLRSDDRVSSWLPLYHDMGLIGTFLGTIKARRPLYLSTPASFLINPLQWLQHLSEKQITITAIPDFAIGYCLRRLRTADSSDLKDLNLEKLRIIYNGSEPINIDNLQEFIEKLKPYGLQSKAIAPCYGMAEAVLIISCSGLEDRPRIIPRENGLQAISLGKPLSDYRIRVRKENGELCEEGEIGEIEIKGGTLVGEYFEDDRRFYNEDGFFQTGDLGLIDRGELLVTGRLGDRLKINGQSYFCQDFETAVETLPFVRPGKTAAIKPSDRIIILVEVKKSQVLKRSFDHKQQIDRAILKKTGIKLPIEDILFISPGQLQKTSSGKLKRQAIAIAYLTGKIVEATTVTPRL